MQSVNQPLRCAEELQTLIVLLQKGDGAERKSKVSGYLRRGEEFHD
jgi:hypothetical protein